MLRQSITLVRSESNVVSAAFLCGECGDTFTFASVTFASDARSWDSLRLIGLPNDQKPRFCPICGSKNRAGAS